MRPLHDPMVLCLEPDAQCLGHVLAMEEISASRSKDKVKQARKLEALGLMVGGTAHDLNNLLTAITGNLELILSDLPESNPLREALSRVQRASWRAADLVGKLARGSPRTILCLSPVNCNRVIEETSELLQPLLGGSIELHTRCAPDLWMIQADFVQLHRVLLNLCKNARDAMPEGGILALETANVTLGNSDLSAHPMGHAGNFARMRVVDTGQGIASEILPRIFDPHFTTKDSGSGVGLGLAIVAEIVKKHQGWIECARETRGGTRFDIFLPSSKPACHQSCPGRDHSP